MVDDDESMVNVCRLMLEVLGWRVVTAHSVDSALPIFRAESGRLAAILCDRQMGQGLRNENGEDLYRHCASVLREDGIPFVQVSGALDPDFAKECRGMGMYGLQKPFDVYRLQAFLEGVIPTARWPQRELTDV